MSSSQIGLAGKQEKHPGIFLCTFIFYLWRFFFLLFDRYNHCVEPLRLQVRPRVKKSIFLAIFVDVVVYLYRPVSGFAPDEHKPSLQHGDHLGAEHASLEVAKNGLSSQRPDVALKTGSNIEKLFKKTYKNEIISIIM
jgi:hypothetical protein